MKHLNRNFRMATLMACALMAAAGKNTSGGTPATTGGTPAPAPAAQDDAAKAAAAAQAKTDKAAADKAAADQKKADAAKAKAEKAETDKKEKADKAEAKKKADADAKAKRDQEAADKKAGAEQAKADKKAAADKAKADKAQAAADAKAAKEANKMPEQNGVRRPKPDSLCGKAWAIMDQLSKDRGGPVPIAPLLEATNKAGLNEGNVRAEYARWRKFFNVSGRIVDAKPTETPAPLEGGTPAAGNESGTATGA